MCKALRKICVLLLRHCSGTNNEQKTLSFLLVSNRYGLNVVSSWHVWLQSLSNGLTYQYTCFQPNELVQVETYLRSEGVLVRFWYPLDMLERPPQGYRRSAIVGHQVLDISNIHTHRYYQWLLDIPCPETKIWSFNTLSPVRQICDTLVKGMMNSLGRINPKF